MELEGALHGGRGRSRIHDEAALLSVLLSAESRAAELKAESAACADFSSELSGAISSTMNKQLRPRFKLRNVLEGSENYKNNVQQRVSSVDARTALRTSCRG